MKYLVGYQLTQEDRPAFLNLLEPYWEHISEIYFSWIDSPSGRSAVGSQRGYVDWDAQRRMENDLIKIKHRNVKLDMLMNANCYGAQAMSKSLDYRIASIIDYLQDRVGGVNVVTTTSPFVAERVKTRYPEIETRASVNMWIGTIKAMEYLVDLFDSYYIQREYNRDTRYVQELHDWCKLHDKKIYMLGNSGCMNFCTGHTFHDNLVAHEKEAAEISNVEGFEPHTCWRYYRNRENWHTFLQNSWVRPEDIHNYEGLVDGVKLATRTHVHPGLVISAYIRGKFDGNLLDLCEPGYGPAFAPYILDSSRIPVDFFERTSTCDRRCHQCNYCKNAFDNALVCIDD